MLPTINGKSFLGCSLDEFLKIKDDEIYRECDCIDYKKSFSVFDIPTGNPNMLNKSRAEFRKDVCAMANAQGGYIVYGVKENGKGVPCEITGISIKDNNTDKFENDVRNILQTISPKIPHFELKFLPIGAAYIVIIYIYHDLFTPYVFLENNQDYRIYKRVGNSVMVASYTELRTMFSQTLSLSKEIRAFRENRIHYFRSQEVDNDQKYSRFLLFHIVPDTFLDDSHSKNMFLLYRKNKLNPSGLFNSVFCDDGPVPSVDGIRFASYRNNEESRLFNNGVAEVFIPISTMIRINNDNPQGRIPYISLWEKTEPVIKAYINRMQTIIDSNRIFLCLSVIGCKNVATEGRPNENLYGIIDRDLVICDPVSIEDVSDESIVEESIKRQELDYLLALGIQYQPQISKLIDEVQI